jgi:PAS domain-containing protein
VAAAGVGLLLLTVTDSIYVSMQVAGQSGVTGTPLAAGWVGAFLLVAFAALVPPAAEARRRRQFSLVQEVLPVVPVVAAAVVAAQTRFQDDAQILLVLGLVLLVLVAAQQVVRALEMVRLANGMEATINLRTTALRAAEDRFGSLIESSDEAIVGKTVDGVVTSWNPAAERLYGYRAEEIVGRSVMLIVPEHRQDEERTILASPSTAPSGRATRPSGGARTARS